MDLFSRDNVRAAYLTFAAGARIRHRFFKCARIKLAETYRAGSAAAACRFGS